MNMSFNIELMLKKKAEKIFFGVEKVILLQN
jgi:hypothetical protein